MLSRSLLLGASNMACAIWVGAIVFQSMFVASTLFKTVGEAQARDFLRAVFPKFFRLGVMCSSLLLGSLLLLNRQHELNDPTRLLSSAALLLTLAALSLIQVPAINAARDAGEACAARFKTLHLLSVVMTLIGLLTGLYVLYLLPGV